MQSKIDKKNVPHINVKQSSATAMHNAYELWQDMALAAGVLTTQRSAYQSNAWQWPRI